MFCKNCGNSINDGQLFCTVCGARVEANEAPAENSGGFSAPDNFGEPTANQTPQMDNHAPVTEADNQAQAPFVAEADEPTVAVDRPGDNQPQNQYQDAGFAGAVTPVPEKPKSKKKKLVFSAIAIVLVVAIAAGIFFKDKLFGSSDGSSVTVKTDSLKTLAGTVTNTMDIFEDMSELAMAISGQGTISSDNYFMGMNGAGVEIKLGDDVKAAIVDAINDEIGYGAAIDGSVVEWIDSLGIDYELVVDENAFGINSDITINSVDVISANGVIDTANKEFYVSMPEIFEKTIVASYNPSDFGFGDMDLDSSEFSELSEMMEMLPDDEVIIDLAAGYVDCIVQSLLSDADKKSETVEVGSVSQKQTAYNVTINGKKLVKAVKAVLKKARNDKELHNIIIDMARLSGEVDGNEIIKNMQTAIDDIVSVSDSEAAASMGDMSFDCKVYAVGNELTGLVFGAEGAEVSIKMVEAGNKSALEMAIKTPQGDFGIYGEGTMNGDKLNGEYTFNAQSAEIVKITLIDVDTKKFENGDLDGTIKIELGDGVKSMASAFGDFADYVGYNIAITGATKDGNVEVLDISINDEDELFIGLAISTKKDASQKVTFPSKSDCMVMDDEEYADFTPDITALIDKLSEAGLPREYAELLKAMANPQLTEEPMADSDGNFYGDMEIPNIEGLEDVEEIEDIFEMSPTLSLN